MSLTDSFLCEPSGAFNVWIADRGASAPRGSGTLRDPFNGSTAEVFDSVMRSLAARGKPVRVNLASGNFETRGYCDADPEVGWQAAPGMKIFGAGIGVTTLKVVGMMSAAQQYFAVGHELASGSTEQGVQADFFEIADLTIDCGITASTGTSIAAGAIRIKGSHSRIRRIKAVNWGTKNSSLPCYVIAAITADRFAVPPVETMARPQIFDTVIDECTVMSPGPNITGPVALLHVGGDSDETVFPEAVGESAVISNCFVDGTPDWGGSPVDPLSLDLRAVSIDGCHGAIVESNRFTNVRTGGPAQFSRSVPQFILRNNLYSGVVYGPWIAVGWLLPAAGIDVTVTLRASPDTGPPPKTNKWRVVAGTAHGLQEGDPLRLSHDSTVDGYGVISMIPDTYESNSPDLNSFRLSSAANLAAATKVRKIAAIGNLLIEGNTFELSRHAVVSGDVPVAIRLAHNSVIAALPNKAGQVVVRNNRFRLVEANPDSAVLRAMDITDLTAALVVDNMYDCAANNPDLATIEDCKNLGWFNNNNFDGELIEAPQGSDVIRQDETEALSEEVFTQACFKH